MGPPSPPKAPENPPADEARLLAEAARELGFAAARCCPLDDPPGGERLAEFLAAGLPPGLSWLARDPAGRLDPRRRRPWARGLICAAWPIARLPAAPSPAPPGVARHARGLDYHGVVRARLAALARRLAGPLGFSRFAALVDSAPILEKAWAARARLGWLGRHGLLFVPGAGSWVMLGELLVDIPFPALPPALAAPCAGCRACLAACPTRALDERGLARPDRCLAYLTIEHSGAAPAALAAAWGPTLFGCDRCQEACPQNAGLDPAPPEPANPEFRRRQWAELAALDDGGLARRFAGTPLARSGPGRLRRNARLALGERLEA